MTAPDNDPAAASESQVRGILHVRQVEECGAAHAQMGRIRKWPNPAPVDLCAIRVVRELHYDGAGVCIHAENLSWTMDRLAEGVV